MTEGRKDGMFGRGAAFALLALSVLPSFRPLSSQNRPDIETLTLRLTAWTAISGLEQAAGDSLLALLPGSTRDRTGNVTIALGSGAPRRLVTCPLDEPGYVIGNITDEGYVTLRRVGRVTTPLFDQQLEGHRVTLFGRRGPVPGVVAVRSTHLTRGRSPTDQPFTVDNAYVDVGAASREETRALGLELLAPVALVKRPHPYGPGLVAAPFAGRRAACAVLAAAALARPAVRGTVVLAFTVQNGPRGGPGLSTVHNLLGPFSETKPVTVASRFPETAVETVALADVRAAYRDLAAWMEKP